jgi:hypothetical protein
MAALQSSPTGKAAIHGIGQAYHPARPTQPPGISQYEPTASSCDQAAHGDP